MDKLMSDERLVHIKQRFARLNGNVVTVHDMEAAFDLIDEVSRLRTALVEAQEHEAMMLRLERERLEASWRRNDRLEHENAWLREYKGVPTSASDSGRMATTADDAGCCPECGLPWSMCDCPDIDERDRHEGHCPGDQCGGVVGIGEHAPPCLCWCHNGEEGEW